MVNDSDFEILPRPLASTHILDPLRRATPTIPPGFSIPAVPALPALPAIPKSLIDQPPWPVSRNAPSSINPVIPVLPTTPKRVAPPVKTIRENQVSEATDLRTANKTEPAAPTTTKPEIPVQAGRKISSAKSQLVSEAKNKADEVPLAGQKANQTVPGSPAKVTPKGKTTSRKSYGTVASDSSPQKAVKDMVTPKATPALSKRQHPGKLDITAATKLTEAEQSPGAYSTRTDGQSRSVRGVSLTSTNSTPASPAAISTGSPVKRSTAPRTLRVLPTPKTEMLPTPPVVPATSLPHVPTVDKLRSRQASIASLNQPGTPASEAISDTASITSTSMSRANSPPPMGGRIGSAPVRKKTKSQAKKERQEKARQIAEEQTITIDEHEKSDAEAVQAPIIGRKKKAKKPASKPKATTVAPKSVPSSPKPAKVEEEEEEEEEEDEELEIRAIPDSSSMKANAGKTSSSSPRKAQHSPHFEWTSAPKQAKEKPQPTAQSIIADLQRTGDLLVSTLEFFKPLSTSLAHASRTSQAGNTETTPPDLKIHFSEADLDALAKKKPVRLNGQDGKSDSRTLITPQGKFFWGLTQELEEKALELEKHIEELKGSARFRPRKQTPHAHTTRNRPTHEQSKDMLPAIATALKEAGTKLSKSASSPSSQHMPKLDSASTLLGSTSLPLPPVQIPNDVPGHQSSPPPQPQAPADAIAYLNQFVLPKIDYPPPNVTRSELTAVGGPPGAGAGCMAVNVNKIAKAAKAVADGSVLGSELGGMGVMAADLLGGVVVQGLEALVGAGLGFHSNQELSVDGQGNITLGDSGLDVQGLVNAIETGGGLGGFANTMLGAGRRGRRSVLSVDEAEQAMLAAKKDHEALEKKLAGTMKRNKKLVSGTGRM